MTVRFALKNIRPFRVEAPIGRLVLEIPALEAGEYEGELTIEGKAIATFPICVRRRLTPVCGACGAAWVDGHASRCPGAGQQP